MNEATLEARVSAVLKIVFPTFQKVGVKHQESFSINFGRNKVSINDGELINKRGNRAIYDILLTVDEKNIILFELKRPGQKISSENIKQGLSYARLIPQMPPITLISNGKEHHFYDTFSQNRLDRKTIDFPFVQSLIEKSFDLAIEDINNAIEVLLNKDHKVILEVFNNLSKQRFNSLKGNLRNLHKPISNKFYIKRKITKQIKKNLEKKNLIALIGASFSGKTNVLYDFYKRMSNDKTAILYVNLKDYNYSIFKNLAAALSKELQFYISEEKVREWINISILNEKNFKLIIILDNIQIDTSYQLSPEIIELVSLFEGTNHNIIFSIDEEKYKLISKESFRNYDTIFGRNSKILKLQDLDDDEFFRALDKMFKAFGFAFHHGAQFSNEFRQPRILRLILSSFEESGIKVEKGQVYFFDSIPNLEFLNFICKKKIFGRELHQSFRKLAYAFIEDNSNRASSPFLRIAALGRGAISSEKVKEILGEDFKPFFLEGFLTKQFLPKYQTIFIPKVPELLAYHGIDLITSLVVEKFKTQGLEKAYQLFYSLCKMFPYNDIVGVGVIIKLGRGESIELFNFIYKKLQKILPEKSSISDGTEVALYFEDTGIIRLKFKGDGIEDDFITDIFPYMVLSQLAAYPLGADNLDDDEMYDYHLKLIWDIGSIKTNLLRVSSGDLKNLIRFKSYDLRGFGELISGHNGIIEPIVQSIKKIFYQIPKQIERLYNGAIRENNFALLWRIYLALRNEIENTNLELSNQAKDFMKKFNEAFPEMFADILVQDIEDEDERERLKKLLSEKKGGNGL